VKRFYPDQRVLVTAGDLAGRKGGVVRMRRCDDGAWVDMDEDLPEHLQAFPPDDECGRHRHVLLYPWLCEPAPYDGVVRPGGPALTHRSEHYPVHFGGLVPKTVRTQRAVSEDFPFLSVARGETPLMTCAGGCYPAWTNSYGAVSAVLPNGRALGLYPSEFEVVDWYEPGDCLPPDDDGHAREAGDGTATSAPLGAGREA